MPDGKKMLDGDLFLICGQPLQVFQNPVYKSAAMHIRHVACPVPGGILKAIEVEFGVCLPKSVNMDFIREEGQA